MHGEATAAGVPGAPDVPVRLVAEGAAESVRRRARRWALDQGRHVAAITEALAEHGADAVHVHWGSTLGAAAARAADEAGLPLVAEVRFDLAGAAVAQTGGDLPAPAAAALRRAEPLLRRRFERHLERADAVVAASDGGRAAAPPGLAAGGRPAGRRGERGRRRALPPDRLRG